MIKQHLTIIKLVCYFIITPLFVWNLTIGKSLNLWRECERNEKQLAELNARKEQPNMETLKVSESGFLIDSIAKDKNIEII